MWFLVEDILLICFLLVILIWFFWYTWSIFKWYAIPNLATIDEIIDVLVWDISFTPDSVFVDLWSWNGVVLTKLAALFPQVSFIWYETNIIAVWRSRSRIKKLWLENVVIHHQNFFSWDISHATHVYTYTMPFLMSKIWTFVKTSCKTHTVLYVNAFPINWWEPQRTFELWVVKRFRRNVYRYII